MFRYFTFFLSALGALCGAFRAFKDSNTHLYSQCPLVSWEILPYRFTVDFYVDKIPKDQVEPGLTADSALLSKFSVGDDKPSESLAQET